MRVTQQRKKIASLALFLGLTLILVLPGTAHSQGGDPQHDLIMQVVEAAAQDLGYSVSWDGTLVQSPRQHYKYGVSSPDHRSNLLYLGAYSTQSDAEFAWSQAKEATVYTETFHGYAAFYIQSTLTRYHFYALIGRFVLETHCVGCSGPDTHSADALYSKAMQHGLFLPGGTPADEDGDGVPDVDDWCSGTPAGAVVDAHGCEVVLTADEDGDGVPDVDDWCSGTPAGAVVDAHGCEVVLTADEDGDGVPDVDDWCLGTPAGAVVDADGCEVLQDEDGDGVPDVDDLCLGTPPGAVVDADGCATLNNPPICSFTIVPQSPTSSDAVVGTSTSVDPDGDTLTYWWYWDGQYLSGVGNSSSWRYKIPPGIWTIKLVVDDGRGGTHSHTKKVPVSAGPLSDGIISILDQRDSGSPFLDTSIISLKGNIGGGVPPYLYEWHFGDGYETGWLDLEEPGVVQASHQYDCPGRYRVLKVVQDATGAEAYDEWTIEVRSTFMKEWNPDSGSLETVYPTISSEPVPGKYPDDFDHYYVKFTCHGVKGGYPPYDYYWDFGDDGITGTAFINDVAWVVHDYWSLGEYTVKVKVFDSCNSEVESSLPYRVAAEEEIGVLVVTSVDQLSSKFGASGWAQIEDRLNQLGWTILDVGSASVNAIDLQIEAKGANNVPKKILILGGHDVVPFPVLPNPTEDGDTLYTDDMYADFDHDPQMVIDVPIARIPDGGDLGLVLTQLSGSSSPSSGGFALGMYTEPAAQRIAEIFGGSMLWSRPTVYTGLDPGDVVAAYDYFNLHGARNNSSVWLGEDWVDKYGNKIPGTQEGDKSQGDKCLYPQAFKVRQADSTGVVNAACCYGAYVINKSPGNSICLRFLKNGARCFVGCTGINYGATYEEYWLEIFAGPFDKMFFTKLVGGKTPMRAFYETKVEYAARATLSAEKKIMHQYVYYGRP